MPVIAIVYFSGYGHTARLADAVSEGLRGAPGAEALSLRINPDGNLPDGALEQLGGVDAIIYGTPTYMGGPAWQFKKFAEATARIWLAEGWKDKIAAGFTNSASVNGDKAMTLAYLWTLSQQHGQIWVGTGLLPANTKANGPADVNWSGGSVGVMAISPSDASTEEAPREGDLETGRLLGLRVARIASRLRAG
ncbi:flavodoxin family protein [Komagataeibacter sp. FNDCR2]|uniref:flavodoxin family protein n=1 Tax=Komagataeibacter sp. FNDCR2 TaxID=2878682 RepID=UPI001E34E19E|nr:flavodoxin family protein [Komagataeibacter sp. FNDCR2]MCE2574271.1 flavodoxin family protein [Komagataeibacter sp. FNDCR2]